MLLLLLLWLMLSFFLFLLLLLLMSLLWLYFDLATSQPGLRFFPRRPFYSLLLSNRLGFLILLLSPFVIYSILKFPYQTSSSILSASTPGSSCLVSLYTYFLLHGIPSEALCCHKQNSNSRKLSKVIRSRIT